jgi:hypothetical protein
MKRTDEITNTQDVIDSRDIIARIEELESWFTYDDGNATDAQLAAFAENDHAGREDEAKELISLRALAEECEGYGDWRHGDALIRESYFTEYAQQLAEDIGAIPDDAKWPCDCIDWDKAAQELQQDYTSAEFDGVTYYIRS